MNDDQILWQHVLNDNSALFKQALELLRKYHEALDALQEYHDELELVPQRDSTLIGPVRLQELADRYEKVMKERMKE